MSLHNDKGTGDRKTWELTNAGSGVESVVLETLPAELVQFPSPPSLSPKDTTDGTTTAMSATSEAFSDGSSLSRDLYMWSLTLSSLPLPNSLSDGEERLLCPLEVCCSKYTNKLNITDVILKMTPDS